MVPLKSLLNPPVASAVTLWVVPSLLVHCTVPPALMLVLLGE
jgi:hypothetical protein